MCLFCKWFKKLCGADCKCKCHKDKCDCHKEAGAAAAPTATVTTPSTPATPTNNDQVK